MSIEDKYKYRCETESDINEHLPTLYKYSTECESIAELGVRGAISSYAFLWGLINSSGKNKKLFVFDISNCDVSQLVEDCFTSNVELIEHIPEDDLTVDITSESYDLCFIDTFHCYPHCYEELIKFSSHTKKYIILHDTTIDDQTSECVRLGFEPNMYIHLVQRYQNKYTENDFKRGLGHALTRFLFEHPEWKVIETFSNNNGLTVLSCI
jgi:hypothetical protein